MPQRKRLNRESLEFYLLNLLMLYRPLLQISVVIIFFYAIATLNFYPLGSIVAVSVANFLLLLTFSQALSLHIAKFGAWLGTLNKKE